MNPSFHLGLVQASTQALAYDHLFLTLTVAGLALTAALFWLILYFGIKYRQGSKADRRGAEDRSNLIEIAWTVTPLLIFLGVFVWSAYLYIGLYQGSSEAVPVFVVAKQWMWKAQHADGRREIDELHLPLGRPVRLVLSSEDVIHSFFVPAFRVKQDAVPGRYTTIWFTPDRVGEYRLFCAEYCGTDHSRMTGRVIVMPPAEYARWAAGAPAENALADRGAALFRELGCVGCHGAGSTVRAPDLAGIYQRMVPLLDGRLIRADERYIRDSILRPEKDVAAGFAPIMPSFQGRLSEADLTALIAYLKTKKD